MSASRNRGSSARERVPVTPNAWREAMLSRVERLRQSHAKARAKLEADIESHPLEPQMSGQLMEIMRMEEMAGRQGQHDRKRLLTAKVDSQMQEETRAALAHIIELHKKQRSEVYKKLSSERAKLAKSLHEAAVDMARSQGLALPPAAFACLATASRRRSRGSQGATHLPRVGSGGHMRGVVDMKGGPTDGGQPSLNKPLRPSGDFAADEEAHRRQVADHWAEGERFNLRQAFKSQMDRIEADWETYLQEMEQEYHTERARMMGTTVAATKDGSKGKGKDGHWLAKEKQDTLIHTAPVLAPNTNFHAQGSKAHSKMSAAARRDLAALDGRFEEAKRQVIVQREEALRWTRRQSERMIAQVGAQDVERRQALAAAAKQEKEFAALVQAVDDVTKRMLMAMANTQATPAPLATPTDATMRKEANPASSPGRITPLSHGFGSSGSMRDRASPSHSNRAPGSRGGRGHATNGHSANGRGAGQRSGSRNGDGRGSAGWSSRHLLNSTVPQQAAGGGVPSSKSTGRLGLGNRRPASGARGPGRSGRGMSSSSRTPHRSTGRQGRAPRSLGRSERAASRRLPRRSNNGRSGAYSGQGSSHSRARRSPIGGARRQRGGDDEALLSTWPSTGLVA